MKHRGKLYIRQKQFLKDIARIGYEEAKKRSKYSRTQIWRLFKNEQVCNLMKQEIEDLYKEVGTSTAEILTKYLDLLNDKETPSTIKEKICSRLLSPVLDEKPVNKSETYSITGSYQVPFLEPVKPVLLDQANTSTTEQPAINDKPCD